jgi:hypothetical protein
LFVKKYEDCVKKKTAWLNAGKRPDIQNRPNKTETGKDNRFGLQPSGSAVASGSG